MNFQMYTAGELRLKLTQFKDKFKNNSNKTKLNKRNNIMTFLDFI